MGRYSNTSFRRFAHFRSLPLTLEVGDHRKVQVTQNHIEPDETGIMRSVAG
jgi:hypothetical protein